MQAVLDGPPSLLDELHSDTRNVVLTLARRLVTAAIVPKTGAADLVLPQLPRNLQDGLALSPAPCTPANGTSC